MAASERSGPHLAGAALSGATGHAEVEFVWVTPGGAVTIQGRLLDGAAGVSRARVVARRPRDDARMEFPATVSAGSFEGRLVLGELPAGGDPTELWELYLDAGRPLRMAKRLDGVTGKAHAVSYRACRVGDRWIGPVFTDADELSLRSRPAIDRAAGAAKAPRAPRRAPPSERDVRLHLLALRIARPLMRRRAVPETGPAKVTILMIDAYGRSGLVRSGLNLAGHLAKTHDVEVVSVIRNQKTASFQIPPGVRDTVLDDRHPGALHGWRRWVRRALARVPGRLLHPADPAARGATLWTDLMLIRHLRRIRSGAVIATRLSLNVLASELARPGVGAVGQDQMHLQNKRPPKKAAIRRHYGRLDAIAPLTEADRDRYEEFLGGATRVVAIPNSVPTLGLGGPRSQLTAPVALAAGRLTPQKGFDRLIPAFAEVARQEPLWTLRICGSGGQEPRLRKLIVKHDASNNVLLLGHVADMARQMELASLFVMTSRYEGFPMVLLEAMSKGLPVVSFDTPTGPADIIEDGRTGFLVPNGDAGALQEAILELIRDEPKRRRFGAAAAERAGEFGLDKVGARWEALLAEIAPGVGVHAYRRSDPR